MLEGMRTGKGKVTAITSDMQVAGVGADVGDHRENWSHFQVGPPSGVIGGQLLK